MQFLHFQWLVFYSEKPIKTRTPFGYMHKLYFAFSKMAKSRLHTTNLWLDDSCGQMRWCLSSSQLRRSQQRWMLYQFNAGFPLLQFHIYNATKPYGQRGKMLQWTSYMWHFSFGAKCLDAQVAIRKMTDVCFASQIHGFI